MTPSPFDRLRANGKEFVGFVEFIEFIELIELPARG